MKTGALTILSAPIVPRGAGKPVEGAAFDGHLAALQARPAAIDLVGIGPAVPALLRSELAEADAAKRDRDARRRATDLLRTLSGLQHALLRGGADPNTGAAGGAERVREDLRRLLEELPAAADPELGRLLHAVRLRVEVELARHRP